MTEATEELSGPQLLTYRQALVGLVSQLDQHLAIAGPGGLHTELLNAHSDAAVLVDGVQPSPPPQRSLRRVPGGGGVLLEEDSTVVAKLVGGLAAKVFWRWRQMRAESELAADCYLAGLADGVRHAAMAPPIPSSERLTVKEGV